MLDLSLPSFSKNFDWRDSPSQWLPDSGTIAESLLDHTLQGQPHHISEILSTRGAPYEDMIATPLSARAALLGAQRGHGFFHHELRLRIPMPEPLSPEVQVWDGETRPVWSNGILEEPKYFSFFQDAPLTSFNPNHRKKWRSHELLHGAQGFFWSPTMTRFEFYVGARLSELLPVVHWYHLDEVFRPRCSQHSGPTRHTCRECESILKPYWSHPEAWLRAQLSKSVGHIDDGLRHLDAEWMTCLKELSTGRTIQSPRGYIDGSRDSIGYLKGHWNRVTAFSFGAWVELFLVDGEDYFSTLSGAFSRSANAIQSLLAGSISLEIEKEQRLRSRRAIQDLAYRLFLAFEWCFEGNESKGEVLYQTHLNTMEKAGQVCRGLLNEAAPQAVIEALQALQRVALALVPHLSDGIGDSLMALGWAWPDTLELTGFDPGVLGDHALTHLEEGLSSAVPETMDAADEPEEVAADFHRSPEFHETGTLAERVNLFLGGLEGTGELARLSALEATLKSPPRLDEEASFFGVLPEGVDALRGTPARLRVHHTLRGFEVSPFEGERILSMPEGGQIWIIIVEGEPRLLSSEPEVEDILTHVLSEAPIESWLDAVDHGVLMAMLENRFLVYLPLPR